MSETRVEVSLHPGYKVFEPVRHTESNESTASTLTHSPAAAPFLLAFCGKTKAAQLVEGMSNTPQFSSEGFDLEALEHATNDVVLELSGCSVVSEETTSDEPPPPPATTTTTAPTTTTTTTTEPMATAEDWKRQGNEAFRRRDWSTAYDFYSRAIDTTPGHPTGPELRLEQDEWQKEQHRAARLLLQQQEEERRLKQSKQRTNTKDDDDDNINNDSTKNRDPLPQFRPAQAHPHATSLAVYYNNRAAAAMQMEQDYEATQKRLGDAVTDCSIAVLLDPGYTKAWLRRSALYERLDESDTNDFTATGSTTTSSSNSSKRKKTDLALSDAMAAAALEPHNVKIQHTVQRLQRLENERMEQLKVETMAKLKDLGNSILGNFGMSLDNFQTVQDPKTGSYSVSFQQNK
jgi:tetratricopeptide (TPR) repeat protein